MQAGKFKYPLIQGGFTLIELMISLVLGLLITAAVIQVYITMVRTKTIQQSGSQITDVSVFGIQRLEQSLRMANLGNTVTNINSTTANGGIILTAANLNGTVSNVNPTFLTDSSGDTVGTDKAWTAISGTNIGSDQLTLQYTNKTDQDLVDCEGQTVNKDAQVIERYFLRKPTSKSGTAGLVLACEAVRVTMNGATVNLTGFGDAGQETIMNVEQFKILLGIQTLNGSLTYVTPNQYKNATNTSPFFNAPIIAIKVGMIVRSDKPIVDGNVTPPTTVKLFGVDNTASDTTTKYIRKAYESTTMLRNARVTSIITSNAAREL